MARQELILTSQTVRFPACQAQKGRRLSLLRTGCEGPIGTPFATDSAPIPEGNAGSYKRYLRCRAAGKPAAGRYHFKSTQDGDDRPPPPSEHPFALLPSEG
jgi:hypothetical protein